jgi:hypothetical protein
MYAKQLAAFTYPEHVRKVLSFRDTRHHIAVPTEEGRWCSRCQRSVFELIRKGYAVLLDRNGATYDVLLTRRGVTLCQALGIEIAP